jgi:hypothetical protein
MNVVFYTHCNFLHFEKNIIVDLITSIDLPTIWMHRKIGFPQIRASYLKYIQCIIFNLKIFNVRYSDFTFDNYHV